MGRRDTRCGCTATNTRGLSGSTATSDHTAFQNVASERPSLFLTVYLSRFLLIANCLRFCPLIFCSFPSPMDSRWLSERPSPSQPSLCSH